MLLFEIVKKFSYVGSCKNSFDEDTGETLPLNLPYRDVSDFANQLENSVEEDKADFLKVCTVPSTLSKILNKPSTEFLHGEDKKIHIMYDTIKDVHYFFT